MSTDTQRPMAEERRPGELNAKEMLRWTWRQLTSMRTALVLLLLLPLSARADDTIRVVVWDEQQPAQQKAYDNFLGNAIAEHPEKQPGLAVRSLKQDDAEQGLADVVLDNCDVLIWWGHARQREIKVETGQQLPRRTGFLARPDGLGRPSYQLGRKSVQPQHTVVSWAA